MTAPTTPPPLSEAFALGGEARAWLAAADRRASPALARALDHLALAASALRTGAEGVAQIQLARRADLRGSPSTPELPPRRPFRASRGEPELHAFPRRARPSTFEALAAFAAAAASGDLERKLLADDEPPAGDAAAAPPPALTPAIEEVETSIGGAGLPCVTLFHAEAKSANPGRAFAVALTLGSIEGRDTVDLAVATLKQSAPET